MADPYALDLELPAESASIAVARRFVWAIATRCGASEETAEDIRLAISEACGAIIALRSVAPATGALRVFVEIINGRLLFEVEDLGKIRAVMAPKVPEALPPLGSVGRARIDLIEALFPGTHVSANPAGRMRIAFAATAQRSA